MGEKLIMRIMDKTEDVTEIESQTLEKRRGWRGRRIPMGKHRKP